MSTAPAGILSTPLDALATLVSESASFMAWVGEDSALEALNHVHIDAVPGAEITSEDAAGGKTILRPFALVCFDQAADGLLQFFSGSLLLCFEAAVDPDDPTYRDSAYAFANQVGAILAEIRALSYAPGYLFVRSISAVARPSRSGPEDTEGDYMQQWFRVEYGIS